MASNRVESLFVSHLVANKEITCVTDNYFNDLETFCSQELGEATQTLFLGHGDLKFLKENAAKQDLRRIGGRIMALQALLSLASLSIRSLFGFVVVLVRSGRNSYKSSFLAVSILDCYSLSSWLNEFYARSSLAIVNQSQPKRVFLTMEGHAYEFRTARQMLCSQSRPRVYSRQFALLEKQLRGIGDLCSLLSENYQVLVSGNCYKEHFVRMYKAPASNIFVVGSGKFDLQSSAMNDQTPYTEKHLLFCPEAISSQVDGFSSLAEDLIKIVDVPVLFRFHPDSSLHDRERTRERLLMHRAIKISKDSTLHDDLAHARVVVYQKSSASLYAVAQGIPLVFKSDSLMEESPLSICNHFREDSVKSAHDLVKLLMDTSNSQDRPTLANNVHQLFARLDKNELRKALEIENS
jgi:hypothetical protein